MGKVLSTFDNGWPGAISRAVDDIVVSLKNASASPIPFGVPVFLTEDGAGVIPFTPGGSLAFDRFVGFTVRSASKTPDSYPAAQEMGATSDQRSAWNPGEPVEVLTRGTVAVALPSGFQPGGHVYIRKADGSLVASAGSEGSTLLLENVRVRQPQRGAGSCAELLLTARNAQ